MLVIERSVCVRHIAYVMSLNELTTAENESHLDMLATAVFSCFVRLFAEPILGGMGRIAIFRWIHSVSSGTRFSGSGSVLRAFLRSSLQASAYRIHGGSAYSQQLSSLLCIAARNPQHSLDNDAV